MLPYPTAHHAGVESGKDRFDLVIDCLLIITTVIPPELPLQLQLAIVNSVKVSLGRSYEEIRLGIGWG